MEKANNLGRPIKTISVNDKIFIIKKIPIFVYSKIDEINKRDSEAKKLMEKFELLKSKGNKVKPNSEASEKLQEEMMIVVKDLQEMANSSTKTGTEDKLDVIKGILEINDIKYEESFWTRKCDFSDWNNFIWDCLNKDYDKKKEQLETVEK